MEILTKGTKRRVFVKFCVASFGLSFLPDSDLFAKTSIKILNFSSLNIDAVKASIIFDAFKGNDSGIERIGAAQKNTDILFIGNTPNVNINHIVSRLNKHALIIADHTFNSAKLVELKALCFDKKSHLAIIESWNSDNNQKPFAKLNFIETDIDESRILQSIKYLNLLSKITANNGLVIV